MVEQEGVELLEQEEEIRQLSRRARETGGEAVKRSLLRSIAGIAAALSNTD